MFGIFSSCRAQPCQGWGRGFESLRPLQSAQRHPRSVMFVRAALTRQSSVVSRAVNCGIGRRPPHLTFRAVFSGPSTASAVCPPRGRQRGLRRHAGRRRVQAGVQTRAGSKLHRSPPCRRHAPRGERSRCTFGARTSRPLARKRANETVGRALSRSTSPGRPGGDPCGHPSWIRRTSGLRHPLPHASPAWPRPWPAWRARGPCAPCCSSASSSFVLVDTVSALARSAPAHREVPRREAPGAATRR